MGTTERAALNRVKQSLPGREAAVEHVFETRESFRGLCRDYLACANALARWRQSKSQGAQLRVVEYQELLDELTKEIKSCLDAEKR
jgi:transposase-like protein